MTNDDERGEGGKKCRKFDDVICERPLRNVLKKLLKKILKKFLNLYVSYFQRFLISTFLKLNFCLLLINLWENHTLPKWYRIGRASRSSKPLENAGYPDPMGLKIWQVY